MLWLKDPGAEYCLENEMLTFDKQFSRNLEGREQDMTETWRQYDEDMKTQGGINTLGG